MTEAVVFDMDGVLIGSSAHHRAAWQALFEDMGEEPAHPKPWAADHRPPRCESMWFLINHLLSDCVA